MVLPPKHELNVSKVHSKVQLEDKENRAFLDRWQGEKFPKVAGVGYGYERQGTLTQEQQNLRLDSSLVEPASPNYLAYTTYGRASLPIASDEPKSFAFLFELPSKTQLSTNCLSWDSSPGSLICWSRKLPFVGEQVLPFGTGFHNSIIFMRAGILLLRLPLFVPLTVLGLLEPKLVGALPGPGKGFSVSSFSFFF